MIIKAPLGGVHRQQQFVFKRDRFRQGQGEAVPAMIGDIPDTLLSAPLKQQRLAVPVASWGSQETDSVFETESVYLCQKRLFSNPSRKGPFLKTLPQKIHHSEFTLLNVLAQNMTITGSLNCL